MHVEFLVEEPSAEVALTNIVPRIMGEGISFRIHAYQGKSDLLNKLSPRLRGYKHWLPGDWRIVVLVDADDEDCRRLKAHLEEKAKNAGFLTKSSGPSGSFFQVLNRLAIEELEAWFFGDVEALHATYPRIPLSLVRKAKYRDPDSIKVGTWEALERELKRTRDYPSGISKISNARAVSEHMEPDRNRSKSFQVFCQGLLAII
jgi:hypothetical protein